eukprot:30893-Pelagococcus_subviridis.AAC.15
MFRIRRDRSDGVAHLFLHVRELRRSPRRFRRRRRLARVRAQAQQRDDDVDRAGFDDGAGVV